MGNVFWFTGLSGSGKTTIAKKAKKELEDFGISVQIIDGDDVRKTIHKNLGFSREDIRKNNLIISQLALDFSKNMDVVFVPIISPYQEDRDSARKKIKDHFFEIYINASLFACKNRDTKGLYKKAEIGEIKDMIGIGNPYEPPQFFDLEINTEKQNINLSVNYLVEFVKSKI